MKKISGMTAWIVAAVLQLSSQSCVNCDTTDPMPTAPVRFEIVDQKGKNLVTDSISLYRADSVRLLVDREDFIIARSLDMQLGGYVFESFPPNNDSGKTTLLLYLNGADTDTLTTFYQYHEGKCGSHYEYTGFMHNGKDVGKRSLSGVIQIVKPN